MRLCTLSNAEMSASVCSVSFSVTVVTTLDATISLSGIDVRRINTTTWAWTIRFSYMRGKPLATAFRLDTTSGLSGSFFPPTPSGDSTSVESGTCEGRVEIPADIYNDPTFAGITYDGTVTIIQA